MGEDLDSGGVRPIFQVNMPAIPPSPSVDAMDLTFHRGAECQKRASATVVPVGTKYTDNQLVHLMEFCSLDATEQDILPEIWTNIQSTKRSHDAGIELIKWFNAHQTEEDYPVQFHKDLVDDIRKLMFSFGASPLVDNAHRGISFSFCADVSGG